MHSVASCLPYQTACCCCRSLRLQAPALSPVRPPVRLAALCAAVADCAAAATALEATCGAAAGGGADARRAGWGRPGCKGRAARLRRRLSKCRRWSLLLRCCLRPACKMVDLSAASQGRA